MCAETLSSPWEPLEWATTVDLKCKKSMEIVGKGIYSDPRSSRPKRWGSRPKRRGRPCFYNSISEHVWYGLLTNFGYSWERGGGVFQTFKNKENEKVSAIPSRNPFW